MSERDRGLTPDQSALLAGDPSTAPGVLTRLANGYPEVWQVLVTNPSTPAELREWLQNALEPKKSAPTQPQVGPVSVTDETFVIERLPKTARRMKTDASGSIAGVSKKGRAPRTRRRSRPARGSFMAATLAIFIIAALGAVSFQAISSEPQAGIIGTQELATEPSSKGTWSYDLVQGQENTDCIEWSFQALSQDIVIVLSQYSSANDGCSDLEEKPETFLASVNTKSGSEAWRVNLGETLSWSKDWSKDLTDFTGLNEIILKLTDTSDPDDELPLQTLIPFNRLDGSITDAVVAQSESDPVITAPHIEVGRISWSDRNIVVGFPASDDDRRLSLRRAKSLTEDEWNLTTQLEPISGNSIIDRSILLGSEYDDEPKAVNLDTGNERFWPGPAGGKMLNIAGTYVHVSGDGTKERVSNAESTGGKAETSDCDAECVTLTALSETGQTLWQKKVPGYAVIRNPQVTNNADRSQYGLLFVTDADRNSATPIDLATGEPLWSGEQDWGDFEIAKFATSNSFFTFQTTTDADHTDRLQSRSLDTGEVLGEYEIPNDDTRIDGVSVNFSYLVDEPDRVSTTDDIEAGESVGDDSDDSDEESDLANEERVCMTGINVRTHEVQWEWTCNGYQHVALAAGNWVLFDKTPGEQSMKGLR